jgi:hypothetical protein
MCTGKLTFSEFACNVIDVCDCVFKFKIFILLVKHQYWSNKAPHLVDSCLWSFSLAVDCFPLGCALDGGTQ